MKRQTSFKAKCSDGQLPFLLSAAFNWKLEVSSNKRWFEATLRAALTSLKKCDMTSELHKNHSKTSNRNKQQRRHRQIWFCHLHLFIRLSHTFHNLEVLTTALPDRSLAKLIKRLMLRHRFLPDLLWPLEKAALSGHFCKLLRHTI